GGQDQGYEQGGGKSDGGPHQVVQQDSGTQKIAARESRLPFARSLPGPNREVGGVRDDGGRRTDRVFISNAKYGAEGVDGVRGDERGDPILLKPHGSNIGNDTRDR